MKKLMALMALTAILTACDYVDRADLRKERADRLYQSAMDDYRSGRIDAAVSGFEKAVRNDPSNASARFQLACLQQDAKRDYLNAFCGYREYLLQHPDSDKAGLAKDRMAICEKELAKALAVKHGFAGAEAFSKEVDSLRAELKSSAEAVAAVRKELDGANARIAALTSERTRLLSAVKGGDGAEEGLVFGGPAMKTVKDLLEEEETDDRIKVSKDAAALRSEEAEELSSGSLLLPERKPAEAAQASVRTNATTVKAGSKPAAPKHPDTYVVEEGDTLYGIAKRFYGRVSAWKAIRDANKDLISTDSRVRAGDTLKLP